MWGDCFTWRLLHAGTVKVENFLPHLKNELQKLRSSEDIERQLQEIERNTCKVEIFAVFFASVLRWRMQVTLMSPVSSLVWHQQDTWPMKSGMQSGMPGSSVAVRVGTSLLGRWLLSCVRQHSALSAFQLVWCREHSAVTVTELLQPRVLACGTLFWSRYTIQTSPTDCSDDSWRDAFFRKHEHGALWLLICWCLKTLTYLLLTYKKLHSSSPKQTWPVTESNWLVIILE